MDTVASRFTLRIALAATAGLLTLALAAGPSQLVPDAPAAKAKTGVLKGWPTKQRLATEFLRLLKNEDQAGLRSFLDPAFLLQRGDGSYLTKPQYLKDPALVSAFQVRNIVATYSRNVRVLRFEAKTDQVIDGNPVPGVWIPRLSTFIRTNGVWRLISHANFLPPPTV
ncbi:MAG: hypothetical protein QG596_876 [Actinomycetota bacterium]|nr:hypothetical protein [Actinomycetota bacterium]